MYQSASHSPSTSQQRLCVIKSQSLQLFLVTAEKKTMKSPVRGTANISAPELEHCQGFIQDFISEGCKQEPAGFTHRYTRDSLTHLLTYLNAAVYIKPPHIWRLHFFPNKSRQNSLWSVMWISVNVNIFAIYCLWQIRRSATILSIGFVMQSWFTPPNNPSLLYIGLC